MAIININEINNTTRLTRINANMPVIAIVGPATCGPLNTPTELTGTGSLINLFGATPPANHPYARLMAEKYLSKGGGVLFTRISTADSAAALVVLEDKVTISAIYPGTYYNGMSVKITSAVYDTVTYYTVALYDTSSVAKDSMVFSMEELVAAQTLTGDHLIITADSELTSSSTLPNQSYTLAEGKDGDAFFMEGTTQLQQSGLNYFINSIESIFQELVDDGLFDFKIITVPGLTGIKNMVAVNNTVPERDSLLKEMNWLTLQRKNCTAIIDPFITSTPSTIYTDMELSGFNNEYMSIYYPWYTAYIQSLQKHIIAPPSMFYINACASSFQINKPWRAVAGPLTGICDDCINTVDKLGTAVAQALNNLYINPIAYTKNYGYYIDGNNVINPMAKSRTYSQLSIRHALNYAKTELKKICRIMSYRPGSQLTRNEILGRVSALLEELKAGEAIFAYRAYIEDSDVDMAEGVINLTVKIYPTPALEEFNFTFEIVNSESAL